MYFIQTVAAAAAKSLQSCLTLCDPIDGSPPGSAVLGVLQARTLEWVAIPALQADSSPSEPPGNPEWAGHDGKQDVKGDFFKKKKIVC